MTGKWETLKMHKNFNAGRGNVDGFFLARKQDPL